MLAQIEEPKMTQTAYDFIKMISDYTAHPRYGKIEYRFPKDYQYNTIRALTKQALEAGFQLAGHEGTTKFFNKGREQLQFFTEKGQVKMIRGFTRKGSLGSPTGK